MTTRLENCNTTSHEVVLGSIFHDPTQPNPSTEWPNTRPDPSLIEKFGSNPTVGQPLWVSWGPGLDRADTPNIQVGGSDILAIWFTSWLVNDKCNYRLLLYSVPYSYVVCKPLQHRCRQRSTESSESPKLFGTLAASPRSPSWL